ncbi:hypothetical protein BX600DRAFT_480853 [Xylariales sp. PMI_506]|nr:hypothetical protein BX600DRAFT_480853 [Xylariales sp. PMI_506]
MRLLCLKTDQVHCFSEKVPPYAILSPSWGDGNDDITWKGGVFHGPELLSRDNLDGLEVEWLWVDTRCIDRSCHAELTEAINSMFRWYQQSQACFVYLDDFSYDASECQSNDLQELLSLCRWFRRGWTLQELIAPHTIKFFAPDWSQIGTKKSLVSQISKITGIDEPVLHDPACFGDYSAARCFSWVARLPCSLEDSTAHALAGLFGVSIAILDEQDGTAFFRLQEMIWNKTRDASVFAWIIKSPEDCLATIYRNLHIFLTEPYH